MDGACWVSFSCLGHERQDFWSQCDGMHVCTNKTSVYTLSEQGREKKVYTLIQKFLGNGVRTHANSNGKIPFIGGLEEG